MKSWSTLSPTKFFSLAWPLKLRSAPSERTSHRRSVESVDADTTSLPAMKRTYETALRWPAAHAHSMSDKRHACNRMPATQGNRCVD